jgi:dihydrofolate reductase
MIVSAIVAAGQNGEIGQGGKLPWPFLRADMQWFMKNTKGKPVVMGRNTYESLPIGFFPKPNRLPLPNRLNVILTQDPDWDAKTPGALAEHPFDSLRMFRSQRINNTRILTCYRIAVVDILTELERRKHEEVVVIGGKQIYELFWPKITRLYLTRIDAAFPDADTRLDVLNLLDSDQWVEQGMGECWSDADPAFSFHVFERAALDT